MSDRRIGLALGGGGARGLAHLHVLAAFDELGVRPAAIAGASIGSIFGSGFAAGISSAELLDHTARMLGRRTEIVTKLFRARVGRVTDLFGAGSRNPMLLDPERLVALVLPEALPATFEELQIPFSAIGTDFFGRTEIVFSDGPLVPVIAASAAIPGLFRPVQHRGLTLIDGAMSNPLPFDALPDGLDAVLAVDVTGGPVALDHRAPNAFEVMLGAMQIMQGVMVAAKLERRRPDALIRPPVDRVTILDFFRSGSTIAASEAAKDETKRALERLMG